MALKILGQELRDEALLLLFSKDGLELVHGEVLEVAGQRPVAGFPKSKTRLILTHADPTFEEVVWLEVKV